MGKIQESYELNKMRNEYIEQTRTEYLTWIVHLFGAPDPKDFEQIMRMTFSDVELYMKLRTREKIAEKARKKREEDERQKQLLEKLKRGNSR